MKIDYPKGRPKFFAIKFCRLLFDYEAAVEIGPEAFLLLTVIANKEDQFHYEKPVAFWNSDLQVKTGLRSPKRLVAARRRAVDAGWLHYIPGTKSVAGLYWVEIPATIPDPFVPEALIPFRSGTANKTFPSDPERKEQLFPSDMTVKRNGIGASFNPNPKDLKKGGSVSSRKSKFDPSTVEIPGSLKGERFEGAWRDWAIYRSEIKKPLTKTQAAKLLAKLEKWGHDRSIAAIDHSIANGWRGVFEPEQAKNGKPTTEDIYKRI